MGRGILKKRLKAQIYDLMIDYPNIEYIDLEVDKFGELVIRTTLSDDFPLWFVPFHRFKADKESIEKEVLQLIGRNKGDAIDMIGRHRIFRYIGKTARREKFGTDISYKLFLTKRWLNGTKAKQLTKGSEQSL